MLTGLYLMTYTVITLFLITAQIIPKINMMIIPMPMKPANCTQNTNKDHLLLLLLLKKDSEKQNTSITKLVRTVLRAMVFSEQAAPIPRQEMPKTPIAVNQIHAMPGPPNDDI